MSQYPPQWQQQPFPQQSNTSYPSQQPMYPQQPFPSPQLTQQQYPPQYQQQTPMMPPPTPPTPKKKAQAVLGCGTIIAALLVCVLVSWFAISSAATKPTALAPTATTHTLPILPTATSAPVTPIVTHPIPTTIYETPVLATPTPANSGNVSSTHGMPQLGGPISDFIGKYGNPNTTPCPPYNLCWFKDGSSNAEGLIVNKHMDVSGNVTNQVDWVTIQSINGQIWSGSAAAALCTIYNPIDAHQINRIPLTNSSGQAAGFDVVYLSASLAHKFTQDDFNYGSVNNNVQPGTFDIQYLYKGDGTQNIDSCSILIGLQQTHM